MTEIVEQYYTVKDLCKILHLSRDTAYKLCDSNGFPSIRIGGRILIDIEEFNKWRKRHLGKTVTI